MTEPNTIEQLTASCATLRAEALAVGRTLEARKVEGAKQREIVGLIHAHRAAWTRFYSVETRLRNLTRIERTLTAS